MRNALKAVSMTDDELRVANYIVLFGGRDLTGAPLQKFGYYTGRKNQDGTTGEWFTKGTKLEGNHTAMGKLPISWEHGEKHDGEDEGLLGYVDWPTKAIDDVGIWVERVLYRSNKYVDAIKTLIDEHIIGSSSEANPLTADKKSTGEITTWELTGDTLTVQPLEPRMLSENVIQAFKALGLSELMQEPEANTEGGNAVNAVKASDVGQETITETDGGITMGENETPQVDVAALVAKGIEDGIAASMKAYHEQQEAEPPIKTAKVKAVGRVIKDELDHQAENPDVPAYKSIGNFLMDVYKAESPGGMTVQLLKSQKTISGISAQVPADGGFAIGTDQVNALMLPIYESRLLSRVKRFTISGNANSVEVLGVDETSRATGSRYGGIRAYYVDEGDAITGSQVKVKLIRMNLHRVAVLAYATGDVLADAALMGTLTVDAARQELQFFMENGIMGGTGAGQPQGLLTCAGQNLIAKETGQAADTVITENIVNMWARRDTRGSYVWLTNQNVLPQFPLMTVDVGTGGVPVYMPPGGLSQLPYATLYGQEVIEMEQSPALGDAGDLMLVDLGQYYWAEKGGIAQAASMHVRFIYDEMAFRFMTRYDGQPSWSSPLTPFTAGSTTPGTISPFNVLAERA